MIHYIDVEGRGMFLPTHRVAVRWLLFFSFVGFEFGLPATMAQDSGGEKKGRSSTSSELTEGLLELLETSPTSGTSNQAADSREGVEIEPKDVGLESEDLNEQTDNPFAAVRQSMLIAAGYLSKGVGGTPTQTIQSDIVSRLDELIASLESASQDSQPQTTDSSENTESSSTQETSFEKRETTVEVNEQAPSEDQTGGEMQRDAPGQTGVGAKVTQQLKSPQALQQEVWGQLPERVRKQMQSKMVEQFLPSHREQIEAYFRKLLQTGTRGQSDSRKRDR
ncbi:MAG: hypothetical protein AB8B50_10125 [Pirellulaceae bacterium]